MRNYFIDTNIFLRFLLKDNQRQYLIARSILENAEKAKVGIWTTDVVILELVWTLRSLYKFDKEKIREKVEGIVSLEYLEAVNKNFIIQALHDFVEKNVDFIDAYNYQLAKKEGKEILSFDKDFKKLGVKVDFKKL